MVCKQHHTAPINIAIQLSLSIYIFQAGLREKLAFLRKKDLEWLERMDVMAQPAGPSSVASSAALQSLGEASNEMEGESEDIDPEDDFKREMHL